MNIHHSVLENETHNSNEKSGSPTRKGPRLDLRRLKWASGLSPETLNAIMNEAEWVDFQPGMCSSMLTQKLPTCISSSRAGCRQYSTIRWARRLKKIRLFQGLPSD